MAYSRSLNRTQLDPKLRNIPDDLELEFTSSVSALLSEPRDFNFYDGVLREQGFLFGPIQWNPTL